MNTSLLFRSALVGVTILWAAPVLAQDAPAETTPPAETPSTVVVQPAPRPAPAPATVVVNNPPSRSSEGSPRAYPGLAWGGVALWATAYAPAVIGAAVANDACTADSSLCVRGRGVLYIPVAGPFIAIAGVNNGTGSSTLKTMLALDGAFQAGGVAMALTGVILSATSAGTTPRPAAQRSVLISPVATPTSAGIGAMGRF
jgi:hypothetical protein